MGGGYFGGDEVGPVFWPCRDVWYWAKDRALQQIVGVGMFRMEANARWFFYIHGEKYDARLFDYADAAVPNCLDKTHDR